MKTAVIALIFIVLPQMAHATTVYVPADYPYIQDAIDAVTDGDTIVVSPGTYFENLNFYGNNIRLMSSDGFEVTVINGTMSGSVVRFDSGETNDAILQGFTLTNGSGTDFGGGRYSGGGIYIRNDSTPTILDCDICFNTVDYAGGGVQCSHNSTTRPIYFFNNRVHHNLVEDKSAASGGGGFDIGSNVGKVVLENNLIYENECYYSHDWYGHGGGLLVWDASEVELVNCTVFGNIVDGYGGGMWVVNGSSVKVRNCIFWGNEAPADQGHELGFHISSSMIPVLDVINSNVEDGEEDIYFETGSILYWDADSLMDVDPLFVDPMNYDFHLQQDPCQPGVVNPCVDSGSPTADLISGTTRSDGVQDTYPVDLGYHYDAQYHLVPFDHTAIQSAVDSAQEGDTVVVWPDSYLETIDFLGKSLSMKSLFGAQATVIDGEQAGSVVTFDSGEDNGAVLNGFTLTNGTGTDFTGGRFSGGGIFIRDDSTPIIKNNIICNNTVHYAGGGVQCAHNSTARTIYFINNRVYENMVTNDSAASGGGGFDIGSNVGKIVLENNLIYGNDCYYDHNWHGHGGGLLIWDCADIELNHCTVYGNKVDGDGGGVMIVNGSDTTIKNCIFWNNESTGSKGQEMALKISDPNSPIVNCSFTDIKGGKDGVYIDTGSTLIWDDLSMVDEGPAFVDEVNEVFTLSKDSPCINRGTNEDTTWEDLSGVHRPFMGTVDMGAYEYSGSLPLGADGFTLSIADGGTITYSLDGGVQNAGRAYCMLGALSMAPGLPLPQGFLPENLIFRMPWDLYTDFVFSLLNTPIYDNFLGVLDPMGQATAQINLPLGLAPSSLLGAKIYHAFLLYNPYDMVSNPTELVFVD